MVNHVTADEAAAATRPPSVVNPYLAVMLYND